MGTQTTQLKREIEHEINDGMDDGAKLASPTDRMEDQIEMSEIKRRTVAPGHMKLSVKSVESAENSEQWAIDIEHPGRREDIRIFAKKPLEGWTRDYKLVRLLNWYGISNQDPHSLEFHDIHMKKDDEKSDYAHGWYAVQPPDYDPPIKTQLSRKISGMKSSRPARSNAKVYGFITAGTIAGSILSSFLGFGLLVGTAVIVWAMLMLTLLGIALLDNE